MAHLSIFEGIPASHCDGSSFKHSPAPSRYVWHHILPQACGGETRKENLVQLCDNCHYTIHRLMWQLVFIDHNREELSHHTAPQLSYALRGYNEAVSRGTEKKMPKESAG